MRDIEKLRAALKQRITFSDNGNLRMSAEGAEPSPTDYIPCQRQELEQAIAALEAAAIRAKKTQSKLGRRKYL